MTYINKTVATIALALFAMAFVGMSPSHAALMMSLDDLGDASPPLIITDNDINDQDSPDELGFLKASPASFNVGTFKMTAALGFSEPTYQGLQGPLLHFTMGVLSNFGGTYPATIEVKLTDTDYTGVFPGAEKFLSSFGGAVSAGGNIDAWSYVDDGNVPFAETTLLADMPNFGNVNSSVSLTDPFSMTIVAQITLPAAFKTGSFDFQIESAVPETSTFALGAIGLLAMGLCVLRRRCRR